LRRTDSERERQEHERRVKRLNPCHHPMTRPRGSTRKGEDRGGRAKPIRHAVVGTDTLELIQTRRERSMRTEEPFDSRGDRALLKRPTHARYHQWRDGVGYGIPGDGRPGVTA
jgi:hypothetical protein